MLELNVYMPFHIILALTVLRPLDIMLALSYISMPTQVPSIYDELGIKYLNTVFQKMKRKLT